jgi:ABC-type dipeptide/oligopeptide/nickel transport system ATPase component
MENGFEFNFDRARIFVMVGKCGMGKSYLLRDLLRQFSEQGVFEFGCVFTGTDFNPDYDFLPKRAVHGNYSEARLAKYVGKLREWLEENPGEKMPPNFLVLDDLLGKIRIQSNVFSNLISTFRHYNMSIFITSQYFVKNISTLIRELTDYAFLFRTRFKNSQVSLFEAFGQLCDDQDEFNEILEEATKEEHSCLLYIAEAEDKSDAYVSYKAPGKSPDVKIDFIPIEF